MARPSSQITGIDLIRFLSAVSVCAFHLTYWGGIPGTSTAQALQGAATFPAIGMFTRSGWVGVEVFFVISGFVIAYTAQNKNASAFVRSRVYRLVPGALACATMTFAVIAATGLYAFRPAVKAYLNSLLFNPFGPWIDGTYWTLGIEISFYTIVWLLIILRRFEHFEIMIFVIGTISTLAALVFLIAPYEQYSSRAFQLSLIRYGSHFALGSMIWIMIFQGNAWRRWIFAAIFLIGAAAEVSVTASIGPHGSPTVACAIYLAGALLVYASARWNSQISNKLPDWIRDNIRALGLATYPLYLLHNIIGASLIRLSVSIGAADVVALAISVSTVTLLSILVSSKVEPVIRSVMDMSITKLQLVRTKRSA